MAIIQKSTVEAQIRRYREINESIRSFESKLDNGLTAAARTTRVMEHQKKFETELAELKRDLQAALDFYQARREVLAQPLRALVVASLNQAEAVNPGIAVTCENMALLGETGLLGIMKEPVHPAVLLTACNLISASIPEGRNTLEAGVLNAAIATCARKFIDMAGMRACAEMELAIYKVLMAYASRNGAGHARIASALKVEELTKLLDPNSNAGQFTQIEL
uniref:Uncharacterized protein n=1 Tax=uncultured prokaryote TaxID=198431 RepID=A0A0H5Q0A6_9ZZZZ|nr:hypothetical protein [uncultured prokaryote]